LQIGLSRGLGLLGPNPVGLSRGLGLLGPNPVGLFRGLGLLGPNPVGLFRGLGLLDPNPVGLLGGPGLLGPNPVGLWFGLGLLGPKPKLDSDSLALKSDSGLDSDSVCFLDPRCTANLSEETGHQKPTCETGNPARRVQKLKKPRRIYVCVGVWVCGCVGVCVCVCAPCVCVRNVIALIWNT
jgi:hypothetical protein